jgi:hypothetical protein
MLIMAKVGEFLCAYRLKGWSLGTPSRRRDVDLNSDEEASEASIKVK